MITEWMALATVALLMALAGAEAFAAVFASLASFSVWLGAFAGYKLSRRVYGGDSPFAYVFALAFTAVFRYAELELLLGGFDPGADLGRIVWPLVGSLMVMACAKIFIRLRNARGGR